MNRPDQWQIHRDLIAEKGLDQAAVEKAIADELIKFDGVALAVSSSDLRTGNLPDTRLMKTVLRNYSPSRSGDIFVVHAPHCFINDFDGIAVASTHGSPWRYDTYVPVIFAGCGIQPQKVYREINTVAVAPTLSALVGTKPPSGSRGEILAEVFAKP